jgi:hypothetical protein
LGGGKDRNRGQDISATGIAIDAAQNSLSHSAWKEHAYSILYQYLDFEICRHKGKRMAAKDTCWKLLGRQGQTSKKQLKRLSNTGIGGLGWGFFLLRNGRITSWDFIYISQQLFLLPLKRPEAGIKRELLGCSQMQPTLATWAATFPTSYNQDFEDFLEEEQKIF